VGRGRQPPATSLRGLNNHRPLPGVSLVEVITDSRRLAGDARHHSIRCQLTKSILRGDSAAQLAQRSRRICVYSHARNRIPKSTDKSFYVVTKRMAARWSDRDCPFQLVVPGEKRGRKVGSMAEGPRLPAIRGGQTETPSETVAARPKRKLSVRHRRGLEETVGGQEGGGEEAGTSRRQEVHCKLGDLLGQADAPKTTSVG
jgi:hypothetical protein